MRGSEDNEDTEDEPARIMFGGVGVGDRAPDIELRDEADHAVALSTFWHQGTVALVFLRHFG